MLARQSLPFAFLLGLAAVPAAAYNLVFAPSAPARGEWQGFVAVTVSLSGCTNPLNVVTWTATAEPTGNPPAQSGADFGSPVPSSFTVGAGSTSTTIEVPLVNDAAPESTEKMAIVVRPGPNSQLQCNEGPRSPLQPQYRAVVSILDDDSQPSVSIGNAAVTEGDSGTRTVSFPVTLSSPGADVNLRWATVNGTATAPADYEAASGGLTLNANRPRAEVAIVVHGDTAPEADETFFVELSNVQGAVVSDRRGRGTIRDDDGAGSSAVALEPVGERDRRAAPGSLHELRVRATRRDGSAAAGAVVLWEVAGDAALQGGATSTADATGLAAKTVLFGGDTPLVTVTASSGEADPIGFVLRRASDLGGLFDRDDDPGLASVADVLDQLCERGSQEVVALCGYFGRLDPDEARRAIAELAPSEAAAEAETAIETARANLRTVAERQRQLRHAARRGKGGGRMTLDLALPASRDSVAAYPAWTQGSPGQRGGPFFDADAAAALGAEVEEAMAALTEGAAAAESEVEAGAQEARGGVFLSGRASQGDRDPTRREPGLDYDAVGGTLGVDYRVGARTFLGLAAGYGDSSSDFADDGGGLGVEAQSLTAYVTVAGDRFFLDLVAGWGRDSYSLERRIALPDGGGGSVTAIGLAEPDGDESTAELGLGWDLPAGDSTWTLSARASYVRVAIDRVVEAIDGGAAIEIFDQTVESLLAEAAIEWTHAASFDWGVLQPQISAAARHEFEDDPHALRGRFVADPTGAEFVLPGDPADATYFAARAGLSAIFPRGWAIYAHGEQELGRDSLSVTTLSAGFRVEW